MCKYTVFSSSIRRFYDHSYDELAENRKLVLRNKTLFFQTHCCFINAIESQFRLIRKSDNVRIHGVKSCVCVGSASCTSQVMPLEAELINGD